MAQRSLLLVAAALLLLPAAHQPDHRRRVKQPITEASAGADGRTQLPGAACCSRAVPQRPAACAVCFALALLQMALVSAT